MIILPKIRWSRSKSGDPARLPEFLDHHLDNHHLDHHHHDHPSQDQMVKIKIRRPSSVARVSPPTRPLHRLLKPSCAQLHSFEYFIIIMVIMIIILIKIIVITIITMIISIHYTACSSQVALSFILLIHYSLF